jgi:hypothetical protein
MSANPDRIKRAYDRVAARMIRDLTLDEKRQHTAQSDQRMKLLSSFGVIGVSRPDFHVFSELLVLYPGDADAPDYPRAIVPDCFVVVHDSPIDADTNYAIPLQPAGPFLTLDYLSAEVPRKDYAGNFRRYEEELRVPYSLRFDTDSREVTLVELVGGRYTPVRPNAAGRLPMPELEIEAGLLDGWVRLWFREELVLLPAETRRVQATQARLVELEAEIARLKAELARKAGG